jgi:hypothetical protein
MKLNFKMKGNALTEFAVLAVVMVPAIASVPMLGKLADVNQSAAQASRYSAWERTVSDNGQKSDTELTTEVRNRFFASPDILIESAREELSDSGNNFWGTFPDHSGVTKSLVSYSENSITVQTSNKEIPNVLAASLSEGIESIGNAMSGLISDSEWDLDGKGFYVAEVNLSIATNSSLTEGTDCSNEASETVFSCVRSHNAIFVDSWESGSVGQTEERVRSLMPGAVFKPIGNGIAYLGNVAIFKELKKLKNVFGEVNPDVLPLDRYGNP